MNAVGARSSPWVRPTVVVGRLWKYESVLQAVGWAIVCWVIIVWRLGYPSFWDPDEAHYAQTTREMLAAGDWLAPRYNDAPFFDKPVLFHLLQMGAFALFGTTEFAARIVPALSALGLFAITAWLGRVLFDRHVGRTATVMLAVLPATFALTAYAILDMTFTVFLFGGSALVVAAALQNRPNLQYGGYALLAAAVMTKGPLALVLTGLAFLLGLAIAPGARRALLGLRWGVGLAIVVALAAPWFLYMWWRFGYAFVEGYWLRENFWLYARSPYAQTQGSFFYIKTMAVGLLPWTPLLAGRLVDAIRRVPMGNAERLLWAWAIAVVGFFTFSQFKYDHYVYPAAPALCLLCAQAWSRAANAERGEWGVRVGALCVGLVVMAAGAILIPAFSLVPLDLSPWIRLLPLALVSGGVLLVVEMATRRLTAPPAPASLVASLVVSYAVVMFVGLPSFERAKPLRDLARWTERATEPADTVATFRLNRWNSSWRFYANRHTVTLETPWALRDYLRTPGPHYVAMTRRHYDAFAANQLPLHVVQERDGLFMTTGRALRAGRAQGWRSYVVATDEGVSPATMRPRAPVAERDRRSRAERRAEEGWLMRGQRRVLQLFKGRW